MCETSPAPAVEVPVDLGRDGSNLRAQLPFNLEQSLPVRVSQQVHGESEMAETARTPDAVKISFGVFGKVEVDDDVDGLDVDPPSEQIAAHQIADFAVSEVVEHPIAVRLHAWA